MDIVEAYHSELVARIGVDSGTPDAYRWGAERLIEFLSERRLELRNFDLAVWQAYAKWLAGRVHEDGSPWSPRSMRLAAAAAKAFVQWASTKGLCHDLPSAAWKQVKLPAPYRAQPRGLSREQLASYLAAVAEEAEPYRSVLALLPLTGQRIRELCSAPLAGIQRTPDGPVIHVRRKGDTTSFDRIARLSSLECRTYLHAVPLAAPAFRTLRLYLGSWRRSIESPWLFPAASDALRYVPEDTVAKCFGRLRERTGLPWLTSHRAGRHTLAELMLDSGASISEIAAALGHRSELTTAAVYARATPSKVAATVTHALQWR